jgi:hypothetical protein
VLVRDHGRPVGQATGEEADPLRNERVPRLGDQPRLWRALGAFSSVRIWRRGLMETLAPE